MEVTISLNKGTVKSLIIILFILFIGCFLTITPLTESADQPSSEQTTSAQATIAKQVAISLSGNLSSGIIFGTGSNPLSDLTLTPGTNDNNATYNFNSTVNFTWNNETLYWVTIDSSTNTFIDICTKTNANLTNSSYWIPNSGFTWNSSTTNNYTLPLYPPTTAFTSDFTYDTTNLIANNQDSGTYNLRFALDVPPGQQAGIYNNTVYFCGRENTSSCSC